MKEEISKLNVFIPCQKDPNPFLDEIINCSRHNFIFGSLISYDPSYQIVLINWPEQLFNWKEPSVKELKDLEKKFLLWKRTAKIIYVVHDLERHRGMTQNFKTLFDLVIENSDSLIHLGKKSKKIFKKIYPNKLQRVIPHPLYKKSFKVTEKYEARRILGIPKDKIIFIAPGKIRTIEERKFIIDAFNSLKGLNKLLVVPNMFYKELNIEFKGRTFLKRFFDIKQIINKIYNINISPKYRFDYKFTSFDELGLLMSACDIVIIPRLKILNSGNVFLALTYKKIFLGPNQGNVLEQLELFDLPIFQSDNKKSINQAFEKAVTLHKSGKYSFEEEILTSFYPKEVANRWDSFLVEIVSINS